MFKTTSCKTNQEELSEVFCIVKIPTTQQLSMSRQKTSVKRVFRLTFQNVTNVYNPPIQ